MWHANDQRGSVISRHSPKGARAKGAWGNWDIGHTKFIPTTYQRHGVTMTIIDSTIYSASKSRKKSAQPKCASCMNHIWAITLFGQARFTPALSAPNHKSQIASDLKSRSPNRKNFPQIAVSGGSNRTFKSRDLWFEPLFKSPLESQCRFPVQVVRTMSFSEKVHSVSNR